MIEDMEARQFRTALLRDLRALMSSVQSGAVTATQIRVQTTDAGVVTHAGTLRGVNDAAAEALLEHFNPDPEPEAP